MANRNTPGSPKSWLQQVRRFLGLGKNRGGAKVGHDGPGERKIGPPSPPPHFPEVVAAVVVDEAKAEHRHPRRKNKNQEVQDEDAISSPYLKREGLGDPACTLESLVPPVIIVPTQELPAVVPAVDVDEAKAERRRPRRKNKNKVVQDEDAIISPDLNQEGLGDPTCTLESLAPPVIIVATKELPAVVPAVAVDAATSVLTAIRQEIPAAETDKDGWQLVARKKRHGGRADRPAQGLALEHDAQVRATAKQQPPCTAWPSHQRPQHHARPWPPSPASTPFKSTPLQITAQVRATPKNSTAQQQPHWTAGPSHQWPQQHACPCPRSPASTPSKSTPPQITAQVRATPKHSTAQQHPRWTAGPSHQRPQHHACPCPPSPASTASKSTPPPITAQHGKREEDDDDDLGIKRMSESEEGIDQEEDSEREEETDHKECNGKQEDDGMHLSYWNKNKVIKAKYKRKTLCLICYLEQKDPVPAIVNTENEVERHLRKVHKMRKRKGRRCQSNGCWVIARNRRDIGRHQFLCHNL